MSLKSLGRQAEVILVGMSDEHRARALAVVREVVHAYRSAFEVLPTELLTVFSLGSVEIIVKAKAGWKVEPMIATVMKAAPTLVELINQLRGDFAEGQHARLEPRPGHQEIHLEGGSDRPRLAAAGGDSSTTPASTAAPAKRRRWFG